MSSIQDTTSMEATAAAVGHQPAADIEMPSTTEVEAPAPVEQSKGLSAEEQQMFGWEQPGTDTTLEDKLIDPANAETISEQPSETVEATAASPGSGQDTSGNAPAPQLDPNQQFMLMMYQQMQQQQQAQEQRMQALIESLKPKEPEAPVVDPFADLPEEFKKIEGVDKLVRYLGSKYEGRISGFEQQLEARIKQAAAQREATRYGQEAESASKNVLAKGFVFDQPNESAVVSDALRDMALSLANVHGGSPAKYEQALHRVIDTAARGRVNFLNQQAKAKVAQKHQSAKTPQIVSTSSIPSTAKQAEPDLAEVRSAGYRDMEEARWDDFSKVHAKRARARG